MKDVRILCETNEDFKQILKKLEELGVVWGSGDKPTAIHRYIDNFDRPEVLEVNDGELFHYIYARETCDYNITADEFLAKYAKDESSKRVNIKVLDVGELFTTLFGVNIGKLSNEPTTAEEDVDCDFKFSVGDKVRVVNDIATGKYYGIIYCADALKHDDVMFVERGFATDYYECKTLDGRKFWYHADMLEPVNGFKVGDKVALNIDCTVGKKYGGLTLSNGMACYGKILTIDLIDSVGTIWCDNDKGYSEEMLRYPEDTIVIGDTIKVIDSGCSYTTYQKWIGENYCDSITKCRYSWLSSSAGAEGKVLAIAPHSEDDSTVLIYYQWGEDEDADNHYLIGAKGVEKVNGEDD